MTYEQGRDQEHLGRLGGRINDFISFYNANTSSEHKTIFFFPGGMGSRLVRATDSFQNGPPFFYLTSWLDPFIAFGTAINLQTQAPQNEDYQQQYVIPDGSVDCIALQPYTGFIQWCQSNWIDLFVFGWDWRRGTKATADFFLQQFLPEFDAQVSKGGCTPHPLNNFWLIGHSFGGMVVKQILNQSSDQYVRKIEGAITVATPFYGSGGTVHRYFKGDLQLNWTLGPQGARKVTGIVSTLPAGYELLFLDGATYDANKVTFANDPEGYNLTKYPSMDAQTATERADPYNPSPDSTGKVRYVANYGFDLGLLSLGEVASQEVAQPLDTGISNKFCNIRAVQKKLGNDLNETVVGQNWTRVPPTFNPDTDADPINDLKGPGDGVLPAWSTRLLGNSQVITIKGNFEHMTLMNEPAVQVKIAKLLNPTPQFLQRLITSAKRSPVTMKTATRKKLNELLEELQAITADESLSFEQRHAAVRERLQKYSPDALQRLVARAYIDALKSPSQIAGATGERGRAGKAR